MEIAGPTLQRVTFYIRRNSHALHKPLVLICSKANQKDVPFDLRHLCVIYYDQDHPFWGTKLIEKIAETILPVLQDPKDAILFPEKN